MKKTVLTFFFAAICLYALGQTPVKITYDEGRNSETADIMDVVGGSYLTMKIEGDLQGKQIVLMEHVYKDGLLTSVPYPFIGRLQEDSIQLKIMTYPVDGERVKIRVVGNQKYLVSIFVNFAENDKMFTLMETELDEYPTDEFPIFGYTAGLEVVFNWEGKEMKGQDFCGLRDAKVHPKDWQEKYKLNNYLYYTIKVE